MLTKRLRIIAGLDLRGGGPIESIRQQAPFHAAAGIEEHIAALDPVDAPWIKDIPLKAFTFGQPLSTEVRQGWRWPRNYQPGLVRWLKQHVRDYDVVMVHGLWNAATLAARQALVGSGVPYVVFTHGMLDPWFNRQSKLKAAAKQASWLLSDGPLVNNARAVLFTSEEEKLLARQSFKPYRAKERVVRYGTSDPKGDPQAQMAAFRAHLPELKRPFFLFLSRIHPKKGCDLLIDAFAQVCGGREDYDLVLAGPASEQLYAELKGQAQKAGIAGRIHWPGMVSGDVKFGAFHACEAFILPSHQENFGIAVAEAMACGKPVLITDQVNIWRDIAGCGAGLVEPDDLAGVARLLTRYLAMSPEARAAMGRAAREGFLRLFEMGEVAESINAACREAIGEPAL